VNAAKAFAQGMARSCRRGPRKSPTTSMCCRRSTTTQLSRASLPSARAGAQSKDRKMHPCHLRRCRRRTRCGSVIALRSLMV
jgi:hypothetical protein